MGLEDLAKKHSSNSTDSSTEDKEDSGNPSEDHEQQTPFESDSPDDEIPRSQEEHDEGPPYTREGELLPAKAPCPNCGELGTLAYSDSGETLWYYRCRTSFDECENVTFTRPDNIEELRDKHGTDPTDVEEDDFLEDWDEYLEDTDVDY